MFKLLGSAYALMFLIFGLPAQAQDLPVASIHWKITRYDAVAKFKLDLTSERELSIEMQALSDQGAREIGVTSRAYNRDLQTLTLAQAYTLKPDGRKIEVPPGAIQTQNGVVSGANGVSWPNVSIVQVTFSDVRNGDRTFVKWLLSEKKLVLEKWATDTYFLNPLFTWDHFSYRMEAPEATQMQLVAVGLQTTKVVSDGVMKWHVQGKLSAGTLDNATVNRNTSVPRVLVSSFLTQEALAQAYGAENNAKALASAEIKALAREITKGQLQTADQARAIYNWMRKNIRYVASIIGTGGYVPHELSSILQLRYGDCKDYQLLFQSLLNAVNIEAVPALINASTPQFEFYDLPVGFDHVITYLPELNLFADATAANVPFGALPWEDADRPVAVASSDGAKLMRTPSTTPVENEVTSKSVWKIKNNGDATLDIGINTKGYAAAEMRNQLSQIPMGMTGFAIQRILKKSGWQGKGFAQYLPSQPEKLVQNLDAQIELQRLLIDSNKGSIAANPKLAIDIYVENNLQNYSDGNRKFSTVCVPIHVVEFFEMQFDPSYQVLRVPEDRQITNTDGIDFSAHYEVKENTVSGWRKLTTSQERHSCSPDEFNARKRTFDEISQHLRSEISFAH